MAQLQAEARAGGLPVTFLGNVEHDQLPQLYRAADLFVTCRCGTAVTRRAGYVARASCYAGVVLRVRALCVRCCMLRSLSDCVCTCAWQARSHAQGAQRPSARTRARTHTRG